MSFYPPEVPPTPPVSPTPEPGKPGGGSILGGMGVGCGSYVLLFLLIFAPGVSGMIFTSTNTGYILYFAIPAVIGLVLAIIPTSRRWGIGLLIVSAASWLIALGPCLAFMGGL
ncbi:hypothetical protein G7068_05165 [Leucobacter viscericola]|uniref:Uncharacterized protein n=1 Tax=Leucobacter viscericola TaxID=2714935 RepID=A0A6G7XDM0_9MICO|nr:hypothetical protein [Leucobacter viscericola]QIK62665.1 hypothetical protein G7068_05165 [Leucobacter viscericola]